ncbi:MAG: hypothetical protein AAF525_12365, partial [Pseudomonadota bacterium]
VLEVPVTVDEVKVSFFDGTGSIRGFRIDNPDGFDEPHALVVDELSIELNNSSLGTDVIHIRDILLDGPLIVFEGGLSDNNLGQLQENIEKHIPSSEEDETVASDDHGAPAPNVRIDRFRLQNAEVRVSLDALDEPLSLTLSSLELNDFGTEDASVAAVSGRILDGIKDAIQPLVQDKVEEEAKAKVKEKAKEAMDDAKDKAKEKLGDKLKGLF